MQGALSERPVCTVAPVDGTLGEVLPDGRHRGFAWGLADDGMRATAALCHEEPPPAAVRSAQTETRPAALAVGPW